MKGRISKDFKFIFFLIPLLIIGFIVAIIMTTNHTSGTFEEYPLVKSGESINLLVGSTRTFKGTSLITGKSGEKIGVRAFNWDLKESYLQDHLVIGDSIARKAHSDKLYLYKKGGAIVEFEFQSLD